MDNLIHHTSHTLQLLIEYDPVRQRLDRLRLGSPRNHLGIPATSRMRLSSPSDAVLERTDVVDDNNTLKRRSLRYVKATQNCTVTCWTSILDRRWVFFIFYFNIFSTSDAVTAYVSHLDQILPKSRLLSYETLGAPNLWDPPVAALIASSGHATSSTERS